VEIIVTHDVADFDALASAVAARMLHPNARIVLGSRVGADVTEFMALHKDRYPTCAAADTRASEVTRVILVDVRRASRLGHIPELRARLLARDPALDVHVWDHHPAAEDDVHARVSHCEPVGWRIGSMKALLASKPFGRRGYISPPTAKHACRSLLSFPPTGPATRGA
jgi:tRNA nucleotidyltransferase (CCA-adding enzyme)